MWAGDLEKIQLDFAKNREYCCGDGHEFPSKSRKESCGIMRRSVSYQPGNAFIISAQLDEKSLAKLKQLCHESGMSMSRMVKTLILGARLNSTHKIQEFQTESQVRDWDFRR